METSDDPVIKEGKRTIKRVGKEVSRSAEDIGRETKRFGKTIEKNKEAIGTGAAVGAALVFGVPYLGSALGGAEVAGIGFTKAAGAAVASGVSTLAYGTAAMRGMSAYQESAMEKEQRAAEDAAYYSRSAGPAPTGPTATGPDIGPAASVPYAINQGAGTRRKKQRAAASVLTRDWLPPTLGQPGLLGIS